MPPLNAENARRPLPLPPPARGGEDIERAAQTPEFRQFVREHFPSQEPLLDDAVSRRRFCQLMGGSLALAGLTGCIHWPEQKLAPENQRPQDRVPGAPSYFATCWELGGVAEGLLVKSVDGRPVKIEGNSRHPFSRGASSAFAQALVLELYDPGRSQALVRRAGGQATTATWDEFAAALKEVTARLAGGTGLHILSEASSSITLADMRTRLLKAMPAAQWHEYEPINRDNEREETKLAFGQPMRPQYHLDKADVIVCIDEDLFGTHPAALKHTRDFAARRDPDAAMTRLHVYESGWTITGAMADHRTAVRPRELADVVASDAVKKLLQSERSLLVAGPSLPPRVHAQACALNAKSQTVTYVADPDADRPGHTLAIAALAEAMDKGEVKLLLILGGNPVYDAPADLDFAAKLKKVPVGVHLSLYDDETSQACAWHLPRAHTLERWGDARAWDGTLSLQQPLIDPLYGGKTPAETLAFMLGETTLTGYEIVRRAFRETLQPADLESAWKTALRDGVVANTAWPAQEKLEAKPLADTGTAAAAASGLTVLFAPDYRVHDGRFANNGWLQELPDPITKLTWDNAALMAPETAAAQSVSRGDVVKLEVDGRFITIPVLTVPGIAPDTVVLPLGYGRKFGGAVADNVGASAFALRTTRTPHTASGARLTRTGAVHKFAVAQERGIASDVATASAAARVPMLARSGDIAEYKADPQFAQKMVEHPPLKSLFTPPVEYKGYCWGMMIDLSVCTGCSACAVACQAENNVPVVGKDEVARGRQMQWLRVDRYFTRDDARTAVLFQPLPCMQCENAPCEEVCPVGATVHSAEGLNDMVYNRCVGTRYCSNNCPYKVRRFNWFNNHLRETPVQKMAFNPDVTVRSRGVMEKCTYCVQRIEQARAAAKLAGQRIPDGAIVPACAQACPAGAIVFGDLNDPASRIAKLAARPRAYALLGQLNTKPRTQYLAKIRNSGAEGRGA
jgi:molybdopterin-containing oxidoreductase family iron-sulfur binding subunit